MKRASASISSPVAASARSARCLPPIDGGARLWEPGGLWKQSGDRAAPTAGGRRCALRPGRSWPAARCSRCRWSLLAVGVVAVCIGAAAAGRLSLDRRVGCRSSRDATRAARCAVRADGAAHGDSAPRRAAVCSWRCARCAVALALARAARAGAPPPRAGTAVAAARSAALDVGVARPAAAQLWNLIRGAAPIAAPPRAELGRKYIELLVENLGQPGFRELLLVAHDMDARRDVVFALLGDAHREPLLRASGGRRRPRRPRRSTWPASAAIT